jgi:hypothetical protein
MGKKKKKCNKSDGIWLVERYPDSASEIPKIIIKKWQDITRSDLSFLIVNKWTMHRIQTHFSVSLTKVLKKIQFSDGYNTVSKDFSF